MSTVLFSIKVYFIASLSLRLSTARPFSTPVTHLRNDSIESSSTPYVPLLILTSELPENINIGLSTQRSGVPHPNSAPTIELSTTSSTLSSKTVISTTNSHVSQEVMGAAGDPLGMFSANPPFWVNPCGYTVQNRLSHFGPSSNDDVSLFAQMLFVSTDIALTNANSFRDEYVQQTFGANSFMEFAADWTDVKLAWLPGNDVIPKALGENLSSEYLAQTQFETIVASGYTAMQTYSVGLEQLVLDMYNSYGTFTEKFADLTLDVKSQVLCTLNTAIDGLMIEPRPADVQRNVMPDKERHLQHQSSRDMRDFIIFRDLINALEYYQQVSRYHVTTSGTLATHARL